MLFARKLLQRYHAYFALCSEQQKLNEVIVICGSCTTPKDAVYMVSLWLATALRGAANKKASPDPEVAILLAEAHLLAAAETGCKLCVDDALHVLQLLGIDGPLFEVRERRARCNRCNGVLY